MHKRNIFALAICALFVSVGFAYAATPAPGPRLFVSAPSQPRNGLAVAGARQIPFTRFELAAVGGDVTIDSIRIRQTGPTPDDAIDDIVLLDSDGEEIADGSLGLDHEVTFDEPFTISDGTVAHLTVAADMAEDLDEYEGQIVTLSVVGISASHFIRVQ